MAVKKRTKSADISIMEVKRETIVFRILGTTPLIYNAMSQKVKQELLSPSAKKNAAAKRSTLKHNPIKEFRDSVYRAPKDNPSLLALPSIMFKACMRNAALDLPGSTKAQIGRLTFVPGEYISLYGIPQFGMHVVRCADINRTPDIRSRAIVQRWACEVSVTYISSLLKQQDVINLMAAAGLINGVGDYRPQKGMGDYGQFELVSADDERWHEIVKTGGRDSQITAMETPSFYDDETRKLYEWFVADAKERGLRISKSTNTVGPKAA